MLPYCTQLRVCKKLYFNENKKRGCCATAYKGSPTIEMKGSDLNMSQSKVKRYSAGIPGVLYIKYMLLFLFTGDEQKNINNKDRQ